MLSFPRLGCVWVLALASISQAHSAPTPTPTAPANASWQSLFDGSNLDQWRNYQQTSISPTWQIQEGALCLNGKDGGDLISKASFANFELTLDWKISEGGNSGVFILADETGYKIYSHAPEIQILDNERHPDNKLASHLSGSLYDMIASPVAAHRPAGAWNALRIVLQQGHLQVWQNQVATADVVIGSEQWRQLLASSKFATWEGFAAKTSGHIGLQDHGDPVCFKNIRVREL